MANPLVELDELGNLIRQLHKIDSKLQAGQFIAAYRENRRIIAGLEEIKKQMLGNQTGVKTEDPKDDNE